MSAFCKGMRNQISIGLIRFINLQDSPALFPTLLRCQCPYLTSLNLLQLSSAGFVPANQGVWITSSVLIFLTFKRIPPLKTISSPSDFYSPVVGCLWTFRLPVRNISRVTRGGQVVCDVYFASGGEVKTFIGFWNYALFSFGLGPMS